MAWARVDEVPEAAELVDSAGTVAACKLWRLGTERLVALGAEHGACAIGRYTQGFATALPPDDPTIGAMLEVEYIDPAEVASIPHLPLGPRAAVFGPLDRFPLDPAAVLVIATPLQAMVLAESLGLMRADAAGLHVLGRPTCAAIPAALDAQTSTGSLACTGARLYAGFDPGEMLVVIPAEQLAGLAARLDQAVAANAAVAGMGTAKLAAAGG